VINNYTSHHFLHNYFVCMRRLVAGNDLVLCILAAAAALNSARELPTAAAPPMTAADDTSGHLAGIRPLLRRQLEPQASNDKLAASHESSDSSKLRQERPPASTLQSGQQQDRTAHLEHQLAKEEEKTKLLKVTNGQLQSDVQQLLKREANLAKQLQDNAKTQSASYDHAKGSWLQTRQDREAYKEIIDKTGNVGKTDLAEKRTKYNAGLQEAKLKKTQDRQSKKAEMDKQLQDMANKPCQSFKPIKKGNCDDSSVEARETKEILIKRQIKQTTEHLGTLKIKERKHKHCKECGHDCSQTSYEDYGGCNYDYQ
jgi:hypothetical protein